MAIAHAQQTLLQTIFLTVLCTWDSEARHSSCSSGVSEQIVPASLR